MGDQLTSDTLSAAEHARVMDDYIRECKQKAYALNNRGPIKLDDAGNLHPDILEAYSEHGFYVFENIVSDEELADLRADVELVLERAPATPEATYDSKGRPAMGPEFTRPPFRFAKPLSDPRSEESDR